MNAPYKTLSFLLRKLDKEELIEVLPHIREAINNLITEIRNSSSIEDAENYISLLEVFMTPLSSLSIKYEYELPTELVEVISYEGYIINRFHNPTSMQSLFNAIKERKVFCWVSNT
jgi:hypothetical protein